MGLMSARRRIVKNKKQKAEKPKSLESYESKLEEKKKPKKVG